MNFELSDFFSSRSRTKVLLTLFHQAHPVPLRHLAYMTKLAVQRVEYALKQLVKDKLVIRKQEGKAVLYSLNKKHKAFPLISDICVASSKYQIRMRSNLYHDRAKQVLKFCSQAHDILSRARESYKTNNE